ncbi:CGNR zinc finger domain-containing protein [Paractinoplanes maris]|uniref:CGNR zinc finger domain-containing protein n=1 Tax=Paractinoplanes maris TaxID=1734446 RepID=UPI0020216418|nr:ABATE domain-containing protein [Actinoplanes maris]
MLLMGEPLPIELMNTVWADRDGIHDALTDEFGAWVAAIGARAGVLELPAAASGASRSAKRLRTLRDAMRRLAAEQTSDPRDIAVDGTALSWAVATVNEAAAAAPAWTELEWPARRVTRTRAVSFAALEGLLAAQMIDLLTGEQRDDLRACLAPGCVLYFVKPRNRREWCSTGCGNRARAARHYQRHRSPA